MDDKMSWADYQPGQVVIEETSQEETVAIADAVVAEKSEKAENVVSDDELSEIGTDDEG